MADRSGTDEDLGIIKLDRTEYNRLRDGLAIARLRGFPMGKDYRLKRGSKDYTWMQILGELFAHVKNGPYRKDMIKRHSALRRKESKAKAKALEQAKMDQEALEIQKLAKAMRETEKELADLDAAKEARESKVAAKIWEPEEDPDRKIDGLHPQIGPFALRGQLEISESECPRGGTYGGGSS